VYATGVLAAFASDGKSLSTFLSDFLHSVASGSQQVHLGSATSLRMTFAELSVVPAHQDLLLRLLWEAVVHFSAPVRCTAARMFDAIVPGIVGDGEVHLVSTRVVPALVTLANDAEMSVRIATVAAFGTLAETVTDRVILEKVRGIYIHRILINN